MTSASHPLNIAPRHALPLILLAVMGTCLVGCGQPQLELTAEQQAARGAAITRVQELGGEIQYADGDPEGAVIAVHQAESDVRDDDLVLLQGLTHVKIINLYGTGITDAGLKHLQWMTSLVELQLNKTRITDQGITHLSGLSNLAGLHLKQTRATDAGVDRLQQSLPNVSMWRGD